MSTTLPLWDDGDMNEQRPTPDPQVELQHEGPWLSAEQQRLWRLWINLHAAATTAQARQLWEESKLSLADYEVLVHLSEAPDHRIRISALADQLRWDRSRMSHHIRRMENRGLLRRESCDTDGRGFFAALEPQGLTAIQNAAPGHARLVKKQFFDGLTPELCDQFSDVLEALARSINSASSEQP